MRELTLLILKKELTLLGDNHLKRDRQNIIVG